MFNNLIDDASRRVCTACERVRRLEGMVTKEALQTTERTAGQIARLGLLWIRCSKQCISVVNQLPQ